MNESTMFRPGEEVYANWYDDKVTYKGIAIKESNSFLTVGFLDGQIVSLLKSDVLRKPTYKVDTYRNPKHKELIELWKKEF